MSYTNYHIQKYTSDATIETNIETGAKALTMFLHDSIGSDFTTVVPKQRIYDTSKIVQDYNFIGPVAVNKKYLMMTDFDQYDWTMTSEEIYHVGGYVLGSFTGCKLPYTPAVETGIITDIFGAGLLAAIIKEDFSCAYAYLRMGQSLLQMAFEEKADVQNVDGNNRKLAIKLNSF